MTTQDWHGHTPESLADLILAAIHREYPSQIQHLLLSADDARPPRELTPAFYGSFDWHSAVHGHWALARLARTHPDAPFAARARAALARSLTPENLAGELAYSSTPGRETFERPYGLAWLLQLAAELRSWNDPDAARWREALAPLEALGVDRSRRWLARLPRPVRSGVHGQTAFAVGLWLDWAAIAGEHDLITWIASRCRMYFYADTDAPIAYEPSGNDFLSPVLGEADLMRRVLGPAEFATWLDRFLGDLGRPAVRRWLAPVENPDPADGHLAHLNGLNLSRAWMLNAIAGALEPGDPRRVILEPAARAHAKAGLSAVTGEHYAGAHWLGSFAVHLLTAPSS